MSHPPPIPYQSPLTPGPRRFSRWALVGGIAAGFGISLAFWIAGGAFFSGLMNDPTIGLIVTAVLIIAGKVGLGMLVHNRSAVRGFLHGIVMSIALVPLVCVGTTIGTIYILCGGSTSGSFH